MAADNELEARALASIDQMEAACPQAMGLTVLVLLDRAPGNDSSSGDWTGTRLYQITDDRRGRTGIASRELDARELGLMAGSASELNMGAGKTLESVLTFSRRRFPATRTCLVLWGHGQGWTAGLADASDHDVLDTDEIALALASAGSVDLVVSDHAYGASVEQLTRLGPLAGYVLGFPGPVPAEGIDYGVFLGTWADTDSQPASVALSLARRISACWEDQVPVSLWCEGAECRMVEDFAVWTRALAGAMGTALVRDQVRQRIWDAAPDYVEYDNLVMKDLGSVIDAAGNVLTGADLVTAGMALRATVQEHLAWKGGGGSGVSLLFVPLDGGVPRLDFGTYRAGVPGGTHRFLDEAGWAPDTENGLGILYRLWLEVMA